MKFFFIFLSFLLILILSLSLVSAIGVSPPKQIIDFDANEEVTVSYVIVNYGGTRGTNILMEAYGSPLAKYVSFSQDKFVMSGNEYQVDVTIDFPSYEELTVYGKEVIRIKASETTAPGSGAFAVVTAVEPWLVVQIPIPGKYAEIGSFTVGNVNADENSYVSFELLNRGTKPLSGTRAELVVTDFSGARMDRLSFSNLAIPIDSSKKLSDVVPTSTYPPGKYFASLNYYFNDELKPATKTTEFFVGTTDVQVLNYTVDLEEGKINKVSVTLQSLWSSELRSIRASIIDFNNHSQAMPVIDLGPFEKRVVETYIDVPLLNGSPFFINTSLQKNISVDTFVTLQFPVDASNDVDKTLPLTFKIHAKPEVLQEKSSLEISTNTLLFVGLGLIIIILIILLILIIPKKNDKEKKRSKKKK